jgi:hypothetical protein
MPLRHPRRYAELLLREYGDAAQSIAERPLLNALVTGRDLEIRAWMEIVRVLAKFRLMGIGRSEGNE